MDEIKKSIVCVDRERGHLEGEDGGGEGGVKLYYTRRFVINECNREAF